MDNQEFDVKLFDELVEQIKAENPKLDLELCKYIAGSYLLYDVMKIEKPTEELEQFVKANEMIEKLTISNTVEIEA
jgi:cell division protein ZapA (FtsZ GTPase activity inhibitor)